MWGFRSTLVFRSAAQIKCLTLASVLEGPSHPCSGLTAEVPPPPRHGWTGFHCPWCLGRASPNSDPAVWPFLAPFPFCNPSFPHLILFCKPLFFPYPSPHLNPFFHRASKIRSHVQYHNLQHSLDSSQSLCQQLHLQEYSWCLHHCPFPPFPHPSATKRERHWLCISGKEDLFWDWPKEGEGQGLHGLALDCLVDRNLLLKQLLRLFSAGVCSWAGLRSPKSCPEQTCWVPSFWIFLK